MATAANVIPIDPDFFGLKRRLKQTWMAGDCDQFSRYMEQEARAFYEQLELAPDPRCWMLPAALARSRFG